MSRLDRIRRRLPRLGLDGLLVVKPVNTAYLSRFSAVTYSRPIAVVIAETDVLVVPELELAHARQTSVISDIRHYPDTLFGCGEGQSPLEVCVSELATVLTQLGVSTAFRLGFEAEYLTVAGHQTLSRLACRLVPTLGVVERQRLVKDPSEIELVRFGCSIADFGMDIEVRLSVPGASELEIEAEGNRTMLLEAIRRNPGHPVRVQSQPVAGPRTVFPHAIAGHYRIQPTDIVIHGTGGAFGGYHCECERTMFVGPPTFEQRRAFAAMVEAQAAAMAALRPGRTAADADRASREVFDRLGYGRYVVHRSGHGMGMEAHEQPHLALTDDTVLLEGMVVAVEPGIYIPGVGGFRHSDTGMITTTGFSSLTEYPRDLESMIR